MIKKIKLKPEEVEHMKTFINAIQNAQAGFREASGNIKIARDKLWDELKKLYPELVDKNPSFDQENMILRYNYFDESTYSV